MPGSAYVVREAPHIPAAVVELAGLDHVVLPFPEEPAGAPPPHLYGAGHLVLLDQQRQFIRHMFESSKESNMLRDYLIGVLRTAVTAGMGWLVAWLAAQGFDLSVQTQLEIGSGVLVAFYALFAALERKWPKFGWLLGWGKGAGPSFEKATPVDRRTNQLTVE